MKMWFDWKIALVLSSTILFNVFKLAQSEIIVHQNHLVKKREIFSDRIEQQICQEVAKLPQESFDGDALLLQR